MLSPVLNADAINAAKQGLVNEIAKGERGCRAVSGVQPLERAYRKGDERGRSECGDERVEQGGGLGECQRVGEGLAHGDDDADHEIARRIVKIRLTLQ
jgi:hypothetical protein